MLIVIPPDPVFSHRLLANRASCMVPLIAWKTLSQFASKRFPIHPLDAAMSVPGVTKAMKPFPAPPHPAFTLLLMTDTPSGPPVDPSIELSRNAYVGTVVRAET